MNYTILLPIVLALNEGLKRAGMPSRFALLVNVVGGLVGGLIIAQTTDQNYITGAVAGATAGLGAGGVYSGVKAQTTVPQIDHAENGYDLDEFEDDDQQNIV